MTLTRTPALALSLALGITFAAAGKPATEASIHKLFEVTQVREQMTGVVGQVEAMMRAQMQQGYEQAAGKLDDPEVKALLDGFMDDIVAIVTSEMTSSAIIDDMVKAYASVYTEDDVQAQLKFYSTPAGRKVVQRGPALAKVTMELMQQRMPAMQARLKDVLNEFQAKAFELRAKKLREKQQPASGAEPKPDSDEKP